jgi:hypothetical protein
MECRVGCGACCIAPSISSSIPGMPHGKPAGIACVQLDEHNQCLLFELPQRPQVCLDFKANLDVCGKTRHQALIMLTELETLTQS